MAFIPSAAQQRFFDWVETGSGNCILEAVAGAGKTTTILNGIAKMHGRVWLGVYNKKMAVEVKEKIASRRDLRDRHGLYASTFHSAGYSALRFAFGRRGAALEIDDKKVLKIARNFIQSNLARFEALEGHESTVAKIVSMAKNRGFGALVPANDMDAWIAMVIHFDLDSNLPESVDARLAINCARECLRISNDDLNVIDFDDMVYLPLQRKLRMLKHEWVLIDEAQDTNPTRRALAAELLAPGGRLVAVGDPYQAIFGFTGADNDALDQIAGAFNAQRLPLNASFRCPRNVVAHAQNWVPHIESVDTAAEGSVIEIDYDMMLDTDWDSLDLRETAILCRYNKYLVALCFKLIRQGIPAKIEGRSIGEGLIALTKRWKVVNIPALENRLTDYLARETKKALDAGQEDKADRLIDQVETLFVIMRRVMAEGSTKVEDVRTEIERMFDDQVSRAGVVTLCSAHKSKGLEWDRVFLLGRSELMPSKMARQDWQLDQERNLIYVAVTRAKDTLIEVVGVREPEEEEEEK